MGLQMKHGRLLPLLLVSWLAAACGLGQAHVPEAEADLVATLASQGTLMAHLATDSAAQAQVDESQWEAISALSTQMPLALGLVTPASADMPPTPFMMCTPPACAPDEMFYCPGECPGGCGTTCATATPGSSSGFGQAWGAICYPGEGLSPMMLYFQDVSRQQTLSFPIQEGQTSYQVELPAGVYVAFAWLSDRSLGGSYSAYVRCNAGTNCSDQSLVPFLVREGHVSTGIDICDWQADVSLLPIP